MPSQIKISLGIARTAGGAQNSSGPAGAGAEAQKSVFLRDDYVCQACGFRSQKYQDIHYINGVYGDARPDNMKTLCFFCHQCFNLDKVATMRSGVLIWLPEIEQTDLHHLARAIYVARISQGPVAEAARMALDSLMQRREEVRNRIGTDDPTVLATVLSDYISDRSYDMRGKKLDGIRLFPLDRRIIKEADLEFNQFPQILAYWRSKDGPFGGQVPRQWVNLFRDMGIKSAA